MTMQYRKLGRTGLNVSVMSQGGAAIGQQYGPVSVAEVAECVHAAINAGVNLIDTAAYYGKGRSEEILGDVLQGGWREKVFLCTKACRPTGPSSTSPPPAPAAASSSPSSGSAPTTSISCSPTTSSSPPT